MVGADVVYVEEALPLLLARAIAHAIILEDIPYRRPSSCCSSRGLDSTGPADLPWRSVWRSCLVVVLMVERLARCGST